MKLYRTLSELEHLLSIAKTEALSIEHLIEASKEISAMLIHVSLLLESEDERNLRHFFYRKISKETELNKIISFLNKQSTLKTDFKITNFSEIFNLNYLRQYISNYLNKRTLKKLDYIFFLNSKKALKKLKHQNCFCIFEASSKTQPFHQKASPLNCMLYSNNHLPNYTLPYYVSYCLTKTDSPPFISYDKPSLAWIKFSLDKKSSKASLEKLEKTLKPLSNQTKSVIEISFNSPLDSGIISDLQNMFYILKHTNQKILLNSNNVFLRVFLMLFSFQKKIQNPIHLFSYHYPNNIASAFQLIGQHVNLFIPVRHVKKHLNYHYVIEQLLKIQKFPFRHSAIYSKHIGSADWHQLCDYYLNTNNVMFNEKMGIDN